MQAQSNEITWLWHKQFGHSNLQNLKFLSRKDMVKGLSLILDTKGVCEGCQLGNTSSKKDRMYLKFLTNLRIMLKRRVVVKSNA